MEVEASYDEISYDDRLKRIRFEDQTRPSEWRLELSGEEPPFSATSRATCAAPSPRMSPDAFEDTGFILHVSQQILNASSPRWPTRSAAHCGGQPWWTADFATRARKSSRFADRESGAVGTPNRGCVAISGVAHSR